MSQNHTIMYTLSYICRESHVTILVRFLAADVQPAETKVKYHLVHELYYTPYHCAKLQGTKN